MALSRRKFFALAGASAAGTLLISPLETLYSKAALGEKIKGVGFGTLQSDPNGLLDLPPGFRYEAFSRMGEIMSDGTLVPNAHDGMAAFPGPSGSTILVRNHELSPNQEPGAQSPEALKYDPLSKGGTTTLLVSPDRKLLRHHVSLAGTYRNCAGGPTPWGSWISCEETTATPANANDVTKPHGYNFEVPARMGTVAEPIPLTAMGRFNHEAIAVDPQTGIVYQTEDRGDGLFYRFIPNQRSNLRAGGVLEALKIQGMPGVNTKTGFPVRQPMQVEWVRIDQPDPPEDTVRIEGFSKGAAQFSRGEGICYSKNEIYFTCTNGGELGLGQVWRYIPGRNPSEGGAIELFLEANNPNILDAPDNIVVSPFGDLFICEDGYSTQFVVGVTAQGELYHFARNALNNSEFAGVCFSAGSNGLTMFLNIYNPGMTFAIWGPWRRT